MKHTLVCLLLFLASFCPARGQITTEATRRTYSITLADDGTSRSLFFWRSEDERVFQTMKFSSRRRGILRDEVPVAGMLMSLARDSIAMNLRSVGVGYPLEYDDVLKRHIDAFLQRPVVKTTDVEGIHSRMLAANVYAPLDSLLLVHGYRIIGMSTEKHGRVPRKDLLRLGYRGSEKIPMPFIVWFRVERIE